MSIIVAFGGHENVPLTLESIINSTIYDDMAQDMIQYGSVLSADPLDQPSHLYQNQASLRLLLVNAEHRMGNRADPFQ